MKDWTELFEIRSEPAPVQDKFFASLGITALQWYIWNHKTWERHGTYRDEQYAVKQAKRKFKKIMRAVERNLLG